MLSAFPAPVLAVTADAVRDLEGREALSGLWALFSKCKDSLQDGRRLENISWRLWYRDIILANAGEDQLLNVGTEKPDTLVATPYRPPTPNQPPPDYSVGSQGSVTSARSPPLSISHSDSQHHLKRRPSSIRSRRGSFLTGNPANPVSVGKIICDMLPSSSIASSTKASVPHPTSISSNQSSSHQIPTPPSPAPMSTGVRHLVDDPKIEAIAEQHHHSLQSSSTSGPGDKGSSNSTLVDGACLQRPCSQPCLGDSELLLHSSSPSPMPPAEDVTLSSQSNSTRPTNISLTEVSSGRTTPVKSLNSSRTIIGASCLPTPEMEVDEAEANITVQEAESSQFASYDGSASSKEDERRPYTGPPSPSLSDSYATAHPGEVEVQERGLLPSLSTVPSSQQQSSSSMVTLSQESSPINIEPTTSLISATSTTIPTLATPTTTISTTLFTIPQSTVLPPSTPPMTSPSNLSAPPQPPRLVVVNPTPNPTPHPTPPATPLIAGAIGFPHGLVHGTGAGASALLRNQWLLPPGAVAAVERSQRRKSREDLNREDKEISEEAGGSGKRDEQRQVVHVEAEQNHAGGVDKGYGVEAEDREEGVGAYGCGDAEGDVKADNREQLQRSGSATPVSEMRQPPAQPYSAPLGYQRPLNRLSVSSTASSNRSNTTTASSSTNTTSDTSVEMDLVGDGGSDCASEHGTTSVGGSEMPRIPSLSTIDSASTLTHPSYHARHTPRASSGSGSAHTPPAPTSPSPSPSPSPSAKKKKTKRNSGSSITGGVLSLSPTSITHSPKSPRTPKSAGPPPSAYNYTSGDIVAPGNVIGATKEERTGAGGAGASATSTLTTTSATATTTQQKRKSLTSASTSGGIVRRASSGAGSSRSRSAGRNNLVSASGRGKNRSTSREPLSAGLEMTMSEAMQSAGGAMLLAQKGLGMAQIVPSAATGGVRKMTGGGGGGGVKGRAKFVLGGKMGRTKSAGVGAGHARRTSGGSGAGLGLAKKQNGGKARKAEEEEGEEEDDEVYDDEGSGDEETEEEVEEAVPPLQPMGQTSAMQQQQKQEALLAVQAQAQQIMEEQKRIQVDMAIKEMNERKMVFEEKARVAQEEAKERNAAQQQQVQRQVAVDVQASSVVGGRRAARFNIGSNSDDGSGVGGKSAGSGSDVSPDRRGDEEKQLRAIVEEAERKEQEMRLKVQQQAEQFIRQLSKPQLAQLQKMQQLHQGGMGMLSRQASAKQVAPPPFALTQAVSKGKERQQEPAVEAGRQVSTSSKGKERSRDVVKSVSPKKPAKHVRGQALPLDTAELEARVNQSLAEPLLPHTNKKTIVLEDLDDDSEFSTDEWSSEESDGEAQMAVAQANTQILVEQAARELREIQKREEREREQRDMFKKLPSESFQNLAAARTRSVGLLTQLMNPDPYIFPPEHPYRRGHSSGEIRHPPGFTPMQPMTKVEERPAPKPAAHAAPPAMATQVAQQQPQAAPPPNHQPAEAQPPEKPKAPSVHPGRSNFSPPPRTASMSKSPIAQPILNSSFMQYAGSFAKKAGAMIGMAPLAGTGSSNGYRPKGRPQDQELESDTDGEEDAANTTQLSKSVAQEKLMALVRRGGPAAAAAAPAPAARAGPATTKGASALPLPEGDSPPPWARTSQPAHNRSWSQGQPSTSRDPGYQATAIPVGHPYNLPPAAPPSTPTTTRRSIVQHELSESLRMNVIWERQVSRGPDPAILRRTASQGRRFLPPFSTVPSMVKLHAKGTINPADQVPAVPNDDREKEARKQRALQRTASLADDYHIAGW
ncbi:hypothetical protein CVT24_008821 [Panaeolus cyanescens]|uniref:Nitrogen regulatory protein areA GATA-like domain-containing protein n=1 Tax=Panaeolus cyanescens TaxID=181874 RepID=A0A409VKE0_9AGAR|nr:hypothetical protein CVT24_008821 [Panaeolus cyanescens]